MTLVVNLEFEGFQSMLGDLCLSADVREGYPVDLPSNPDFESPSGQGKIGAPIGLCQKLVYCGSNILLGWAGSLRSARKAINELRALNANDDMTYPQLQSYFSSSGRSHDISVMGLLSDGGVCRSFTFADESAILHISTPHGSIRAIGSGARSYAELLSAIEFDSVAAAAEPRRQAAVATFNLASALWRNEVKNPNYSISSELFGGGYEVAAVCPHNHIHKAENITYMYWDVVVDANDKIISGDWSLAFWLQYVDEVLILRRVTPQTRFNTRFLDFRNYIIGPAYRDTTIDEVIANFDAEASFDPEILCNSIDVRHEDQERYGLEFVNIARPGEQLLTFKRSNGQTVLEGIDRIRMLVENEIVVRRQLDEQARASNS